jgi:two-component system sensor histidine kinase AlgZ
MTFGNQRVAGGLCVDALLGDNLRSGLFILSTRHCALLQAPMREPDPASARLDAPITRPATLDGASTRPSELRSGVFGSSVLGQLDAHAQAAHLSGAGSAFDVCHVGVVLRAVLLVQAVVALGVLYTATHWDEWVGQLARGSILSLWGVVAWLAVACALKRWLAHLPTVWQWVAATTLGALCATLGATLLRLTSFTDAPERLWIAPLLSGAAMAAALFYWLRLRAQAQLPADTTARLAELQSRIRPHFLFNTLNTAMTLVRVDPARAEAVLEDLAELFRVALSEAGESVSLADEVELARRYLDIEQVRFGQRLQVSWDIDANANGARVPPLLLQPLVENAVRHGVEPDAAGGVIRVRTRVKRAHAVIDIVNSVCDTPSQPGHGIALLNVRERLRLMHDVAAQFEARRERDVFRVQIVVPMTT